MRDPFLKRNKFRLLIHAAFGGLLDQTVIMGDAVIKAKSPGEVIGVISISGENPTGDIAAQPALTDDIDRFSLGKF